MKKTFITLLLTVFAQFFIFNQLSAQELEAWDWSKNVTFHTYSDMVEVTNNAEEFEAKSDNMHMHIMVMNWEFSSYEDMGSQLGEFALELGFSSENSEIDELNNDNLPGAYILGKVDGENTILFIVGNDELNVSVVGIVKYANGYRSDALRIVRKIYID